MSRFASTIPRSEKVDGRHVSTDDKRITYSPSAWLSSDNRNTLETFKFQVRPDRDISSALASTNILKVRDALVEYEGGDISAVVPIANAVIEHRANMGVATVRGSTNDSNMFPTGYMVTYASVGIPEDIYRVIVKKLESAVGSKVRIELDKAQANDGYMWFPIKLPNPVKVDRGNVVNNRCMTTVYVYTEDGGSQEAGDLLNYMTTVGQSIVCYVTVALRLKHTRRRNMPDSNVYQLAMTLVGVQAVDVTDLSCPPLNTQTGSALVSVPASNRLMKAMTQESEVMGEDEEDVEEDETQERHDARDEPGGSGGPRTSG